VAGVQLSPGESAYQRIISNNSSCSLLLNLPSPHVTNTHYTHLPIPLLSLGKRTGLLYGLSAGVQSRLDTCPQRTNERTTTELTIFLITGRPTHSVGGQASNGRWRLSSSVVCNAAGRARGQSARRVCGRSGGRHSMAGQYGYVPLGRHVVPSVVTLLRL